MEEEIKKEHAAAENFPEEWYVLSNKNHFWMQWRLNTLRLLFEHLGIDTQSEAKVLDIGCGAGTFADQLESITSWIVDGVDLHPWNLEGLWQAKGSFRRLDIFSEQAESIGQYQHIFLMDVIEHLEDPVGFLKQSLNFLQSEGRVVINVPALNSLFSIYDTEAGHLRRYNKTTLLREVQAAGIQVEAMRYWGFSMVPLLWVRKIYLGLLSDQEKVIERGFQPPSVLIDKILRLCMQVELKVQSNFPTGSSLMLIGKKESR